MKGSITIKELKKQYPNLANTLDFYYPIGIKQEDPIYNKYVGTQVLNSIIEENILNNEIFVSRWEKDFLDKLEKRINHKIIGATLGLVPNIGGLIELYESDDLRNRHQMHFYVSLIKSYYSIQFIKSYKYMKHKNGDIGWGAEELIVSPVDGYYKELFFEIENYIKEKLPDAKFLPYSIDQLKLEGLQVSYSFLEDCEIGRGFFHKFFAYEAIKITGDINYRINELD